MREILFRGKRIDNGEWVEGGYKCEKVGEYFTAVFIVEHLTSGVWENHRVNPATVGQYTGLADKNGKKVFEGDIVSTDGDMYICYWDIGNIEFALKSELETFGIGYVYPDVEVVGNIDDNPELMEV